MLVNPDNDSAEAVGEALIFKNHAFSSELQGVVCIRCVRSVSAQEPSISSEDVSCSWQCGLYLMAAKHRLHR